MVGVLIDLRIYSGQITTGEKGGEVEEEHVAKNGVWGATRVRNDIRACRVS